MAGKRGTIDYVTSMILGVALALLLIFVTIALYNAFFGKVECSNKAEWGAIARAVTLVESGVRSSIEIPFFNGDCPLVSFTKGEILEIAPGSSKLLTDDPQLCLCKLKKSKCDPLECYRFKKVKEVRLPLGGQVSTKGLKQYMFVRFERQDASFVVSVKGETKKEQQYVYESGDEPEVSDVEALRLVRKVSVAYTVPGEVRMKGVEVDARPEFYPVEMRIVKGVFPQRVKVVLERISAGGVSAVKPEQVKSMNLEVLLLLDHVKALAEEGLSEKELRLFYKKEEEWPSVSLKCEMEKAFLYKVSEDAGLDVVPCAGMIEGFAEEFALGPWAGNIG